MRGHSAQATSVRPIAGMTKCSRIARGFGCGSGMGFAAEMKPKAGLGLRASRSYPSSASSSNHFVDQSECGDQVPQVGHWVEVHWRKHHGKLGYLTGRCTTSMDVIG